MSRITRTIQFRAAQIHASTLFAVILAIVAGLIFAWVFKMVFLNGKVKPIAAVPTRHLTVAAVNLLDKMQIMPGQVKTITISEEEYNSIVNDPKHRSRIMLTGNQPVSRVTIKPIRAEEPIFEDELEPFQYPEPVSVRLRDGKRAVQIDIPAGSAMIQVGDHVDVWCTLANDNGSLPSGNTATAALAHGLRVIARFNTTRTGAQPPPGVMRSYTLEASPYRASLIHLARTIGGSLTLLISPRQIDEQGNTIAVADTSLDDPSSERVTMEDLARIFGIAPPSATPVWTVERWSSIYHTGSFTFPGHVNGSANAPPQPRAGNGQDRSNGNGYYSSPLNGNGNGNGHGNGNGNGNGKRYPVPSSGTPLSRNLPMPVLRGFTPARGAFAVNAAALGSNYGFRPPSSGATFGATAARSCPTCGKH